ncbi:hypothetical protein KP509_16G030700 [Ceratopteris richardii]|nr:hypothetical protein KP509_16G030700 [Ceratopteris richardii]
MKKQKRNLDAIEVFGVDPASAIGHMVTGVIDGKTEEGYFVTVVVGTEKLTGIIYHVSSDCENNQFASIPSLLDGIGSGENTGSLEVQLYNKIKKEPIRKENFVSPKRPRTAYNIFHKEQYEKLIQLYPSAKGLGKKVIEMWGRLPEDEKAAYIARSNQEREKYVMESGGSKKSRIRATGLAVDACSNETSIGESDAYCVSHDYRVSLEPENDISIDHPHIPNPDQSSLAYQPNGPPYPRHTGVIDNPFIPEQSCGIQKGDIHKQKHVPEGARDDGDSEEKCEGEEDQAVYRPKIASEENDIGVYGAPEKEAGMQESSYGFPLKQPIPPQLGPHGAYVTDNRPYFGPGHVYVYGSPVPPPQIIRSQGSFPIRSFGQTSYPMQQNGKFVYPHMNSMHSEASGNHMMIHHQQCFPHDQAAIFHRQEDVSPYPGPFYQHQGVMPGIDMQQAPLDHAYQESYSYPMHLTHSQMYGRLVMRGYPIRFPHTPYPTPWSDSQAIQYSHAYAPPMHPSQVSVTEGSAVKLDSQVDDGRCDNQA